MSKIFKSNKIFIYILAGLIFSCFYKPIQAAQNANIKSITEFIPDSINVENKVVYVDFWASWCVPCRKSFPWMQEMLTKYADSGLVIITVNVDKDKMKAQTFLEGQNLQSISIFDPKGEIAKKFKLEVMPTSFIYNKAGLFEFKHEGFLNEETKEFENKLLVLLNGEDLKHE